jgi:hypothetical protein
LHENIQHVAVLIHSTPQLMAVTLDGQKARIAVPLVPRPGTLAPELSGCG